MLRLNFRAERYIIEIGSIELTLLEEIWNSENYHHEVSLEFVNRVIVHDLLSNREIAI